MTAAAENQLFYPRLFRLLLNHADWGEHHHLAGTDEEVNAGKAGNYAALVSDFPLAD